MYSWADALANRVEDDWGTLTWTAGGKLGNAKDLRFGRVVIKVGMQNPRHTHPNCEEVLHLLSGKLKHSAGEDSLLMEAGDTIVIPANVFHNAVSIGDEDADMIVSYSSADRQIIHEE